MPQFLSDIKATKTINIDFTTANDESRKLYWDNDNHTLSLEMGNGVIQQIGQEQLSEVRNSTGSTILNGTVVMITGSVGESGRLTVAPSINNGSIHSREIVGITTQNILSGEDGIVTSFGLVRDISISIKPSEETWAAGQRLYTNPTIVGGMTNIEPSAPNLKVIIGQVVYVDEIKVSIFVRLSHGSYLGVDTTGEYVATITQGSGIIVTGGTGETSTPTIAHGDTSSATSISSDNSNGIVIQDITITLDEFGHATAASVGTVDLDGRYYTETEIDTNFQNRSEKGQANGYASLGSDGLVPTAQLPSYVDDVLEFANLESFPETGETGKIYVALDTNKIYRWSGSVYIYITSGAVDSVGGYTGVVSASNLLTAIETVDGASSGLDADLLDGQHGSYYAQTSNLTTHINNDLRHTNYALADGTNTYTVTLNPIPTVYTAGMLVNFKVSNANTGASTLNCNGLGAKSIYKNVSDELEADDIKIGQIVTVIYDGTSFQIVSGSGGGTGVALQYQTPQCGDVKLTTSLDNVHLWCDGQEVSRTTYSQLFAVIGTQYGIGDGVTTFNIPDFNDGGLFHKYAICFANIKENLQSPYFIPFTDIESLATVKSYYGTTPPAGWLWTQGQAISRIAYAPLFAVIGETYGAGDGVNTFNIPSIGTNYIIKAEHLLNEQFLGDAGNVSAIEETVTNNVLDTFAMYKFEYTQGITGTSTIISLDKTIYGSAEYTLQVTQNSIREMTKLLVTWSGTDVFFTEYGRIGGTTDVVFGAVSNGNAIDITITSTAYPATVKGKVNAIDL